MKGKTYLLRLDKTDQENRKVLELAFRKQFGRKIDFSIIIRGLIQAAVDILPTP